MNYQDKEKKKQGVKIPDCFMIVLWQRQACKDMRNILLQSHGEELFNAMYESAWQKLKERLP